MKNKKKKKIGQQLRNYKMPS